MPNTEHVNCVNLRERLGDWRESYRVDLLSEYLNQWEGLVHYLLIPAEEISANLSPNMIPQLSDREKTAGQIHEVRQNSTY